MQANKLCLKSHVMRVGAFEAQEQKRQFRCCDICKKNGSTQNYYSCKQCQFDLCPECAKMRQYQLIQEWNSYNPDKKISRIENKPIIQTKITTKLQSNDDGKTQIIKQFGAMNIGAQTHGLTNKYTSSSYTQPSNKKSNPTCNKGHSLKFGRSQNNIVNCDKCTLNIPPFRAYFCQICNYDVCQKCVK